jgi:L-type amino acid transporter 9
MKESFGANPSAELSSSSAISFGGQLEKKNSITSVETGLSSPHSVEVEENGPVVVPHMGLVSSCNMVSYLCSTHFNQYIRN